MHNKEAVEWLRKKSPGKLREKELVSGITPSDFLAKEAFGHI